MIEPTPKPKPLAAEVPVAKKPVTLMFRLPSEDAPADAPAPAPAPVPCLLSAVPEVEDAQGEELALNRDAKSNNPYALILALSVLAVLYVCILSNERDHSHVDL